MARKLASVVRISKVSPIENADRLEVAEMEGKGWRVVIQKGEFTAGAVAVYFEIDSFLDPTDERYAFLRDRCLRKFVSKGGNVLREGLKIKTIKLRGVVSQGLLMPLDKFPEIIARVKGSQIKGDGTDIIGLSSEEEGGVILQPLVGADVTNLLKVEHYDEVKEQLQPVMGNPISADAMGSFPSLIPRSDEERLANLTDWFKTMKGRKWQITEKADGTSTTCAYSPTIDAENPVIVCSRNLRLKRETAAGTIPVYWQMAEKYGMPEKLKKFCDETGVELAIQFETVGPGVNGDKDKYLEHEGLVFRIWDITHQQFFNPNETVDFCKRNDLPHVRVLETDFPFFDKVQNYDKALKMAEGKTLRGNEREGIVCKTCDDGAYASMKVINNRYLLKQED